MMIPCQAVQMIQNNHLNVDFSCFLLDDQVNDIDQSIPTEENLIGIHFLDKKGFIIILPKISNKYRSSKLYLVVYMHG